MRRPAPLVLLAVCAVLGTGCGGSSAKPRTSTARARTTAASGPDRYGCTRVAKPAPKGQQHLRKPTASLDPAKTWSVRVVTNCGTFAFRLDVKDSPKTSASFAALVRRRFFDGLTFHRISPGFVIQGGDPLGTGAGGPGYSVVEPPPPGIHYTRGTVAMAKTGTEPSGTSGSQFFVVTAEDATTSAGLTPDYAVVGKVSSGAGVVQRIGSIPSDPQLETPTEPIVMSKVTLSSK